MKIRRGLLLLLITGICLSFAGAGVRAAKKFRFNATNTFVYDPFDTGGGFADWLAGIGEGDFSNCRTNDGLLLQKNVPTLEIVAAGTSLENLAGAVVGGDDAFGYDIRNDSPCLAGSPRFNVTYTLPDGTEGFSFVGGCVNGTITASPQNLSWRRVNFGLQSQAYPAIPVGSVIKSVYLIVDDQGTYNLDNISFRDLYFDKPGSFPNQAPRCSF